MFGYVYPDKPELKFREFAAYRAVYCSLCSELREFGFGAKGLLNYDFVFSAMLHMSLSNSDITPYEARCNTNPLEKVILIKPNDALHYSAAALVISSYYKLADNVLDERFFKKAFAVAVRFAIRGAYRNARRQYPDFDACIASKMEAQRIFEKSGIDSLDRACDATACGLSFFFENMSEEKTDKTALARLGYLIGRYVYLADCGDDLHDDLKHGSYNPLTLRFGLSKISEISAVEEALSELKIQLNSTIAQIESCYRLLKPQCYKSILDNIIYRGLLKTVADIGVKKKGKQKI
ncbi:MAG: DUF5685 family protein [Oscillospiraceae bacterium]